MAFKLADFIKETSIVTGTSADIDLNGAVAQYSAFSSFLANADTTWWFVRNADGSEWECRESAYISGTNKLARSGTLLGSSTGSAVNFSAGTKTVLCGLPAAVAARLALLASSTGSGAAVLATAPALTNPVVGTQAANDNSTKAASTAYADAVRDTPRVLSLGNGATSANLSGIDVVILPAGNGSSSTLSSFSNAVASKLYVFYNTGGSDGIRNLSIDRSNAFLNGSANSSININDVQLIVGRNTTQLIGAAPVSDNG